MVHESDVVMLGAMQYSLSGCKEAVIEDWEHMVHHRPERGWRWGKRALLLAVLAAVAALIVIGALVIRTSIAAVDGALSNRATQVVPAPDGRWSLVVKRSAHFVDESRTTVYLQSCDDGDQLRLYDGSVWLGKRAVRWLDARTVSIGGTLQMPFVEHAVSTGSESNSGVPLRKDGYVRNTLVSGQRMVLLSGLSLVPFEGWAGELLTRRTAAGTAPWQRFDGSTGSWSVQTLRLYSDVPAEATAGDHLGRSQCGRVVVTWNRRENRVYVITRLPGRMTGLLVTETSSAIETETQARKEVEGLARRLGLRGDGRSLTLISQ